jgi:hypothetical protein
VRRGAPAALRELAQVDRAGELRLLERADSLAAHQVDEVDVELLAWLAAVGHALTPQLHRRFGAGRSLSTTRRRLLRLFEGALVDRWQPHRPDGGGLPICYAVAPAGQAVVADRRGGPTGDAPLPSSDRRWPARVRHDLHLAAWVIALEAALRAPVGLAGREASLQQPPRRRHGEGSTVLGPAGLAGAGRVAHDFLRTGQDDRRRPVTAFETVRPDCTIQDAPTGAAELYIELDLRSTARFDPARLERYDHLLAGWQRTQGSRREFGVVFVLRDEESVQTVCELADRVASACLSYPGEHPRDWSYRGRRSMWFCAEEDAHRGSLRAWQPPALPPSVRGPGAPGAPVEARLPLGETAVRSGAA